MLAQIVQYWHEGIHSLVLTSKVYILNYLHMRIHIQIHRLLRLPCV